jgi:hypothetical protein
MGEDEPGTFRMLLSHRKRSWQKAALAALIVLLLALGAVALRNFYFRNTELDKSSPAKPTPSTRPAAPIAVPGEQAPALPLPDKPAIAVLRKAGLK